MFEGPPIFDIARLDLATLERNIKFIAESLGKHIYGIKNDPHIFEGSNGINHQFVKVWTEILSQYPRFLPYLLKDSPILVGFEKILNEWTSQVSKQVSSYDSDYTFYTSSGIMQMSLLKTKSFSFDLIISVAVTIYLITIALILSSGKALNPLFASLRDLFITKKRKNQKAT